MKSGNRTKAAPAKKGGETRAPPTPSLPKPSTHWLLPVLVLVGVMGSLYILYALRSHALSDEHRISFRASDAASGAAAVADAAEGETLESPSALENSAIKVAKPIQAPPAAKAQLRTVPLPPPPTQVVAPKKQSPPPPPPPPPPPLAAEKAKPKAKATAPALYEQVDYSGLYRADGEHESYAGAWLAPKRRLLNSYPQINRTSNLEGSTMAVSGYGRHGDARIAVMTRDFFDFQVLHLSVTTNFIDSVGRGGGPAKLAKQLQERVREQMTHTVRELERPTETMGAHGDARLSEQTIALIPFTGFAASTDKSAFQAEIRKLYFKATFFSVYRYIRTIVVTVPTQNDYDVLLGMGLPVWKILNFKARYDLKVNTEHPLSTVRLPKHSIMHVIDKMRASAEYSRFQYVYYSEGDLVLHMRSERQLMDALDASGGEFAAAPHRMQSNPLPKAYSPELQTLWKHSSPHRQHLELLKGVTLETEDAYLPKGSCCDDGRFDFRDCGNWWYYCPVYGLANFTTWIRFGEHGFTLPLGTEHRAKCAYSRQRKTCSLPPGCKHRVPQGTGPGGVCGEVPKVPRIGF